MLGRHIYRVHRTAQGWTVTKEGENQPRGGFLGREEATAEAVRAGRLRRTRQGHDRQRRWHFAEEWLIGADGLEKLGT
jgi:hypothetical protein